MKLTKLRTITSLFTVAAVAGVVALAIPANGAGTTDNRFITVTGVGTVSVVPAGTVSVAVLARAVTDADAALAGESKPDRFATVVNVYAVPAVKPEIVHDPDAPVTVHFAPPGVAVTSYDVGVTPPDDAVTVIVALSSPATTEGTPGVFGSGRGGAMLVTCKVNET